MEDSNFNFSDFQEANVKDIKDYFFKIISHWPWFILTILIALSYAYYKNISTQRIYGLKTTIAIKEKQNPLFSSSTNIAFNWGGVSDKVESIRKIITSRTHNEKVVEALKLYINYYQKGRFRYDDVYGKTPFKVALKPNSFQALNKLIKIEFIDDNTFNLSIDFGESTSYTIVNYDKDVTKSTTVNNAIAVAEFKVNTPINLPYFNGTIDKLETVSNLKGKVYYIKFSPIISTVKGFQNVRTGTVKGTSILELSLMGPNKAKIADYLNKTVEVLSNEQLLDKTNYARSTKEFIDEQFRMSSDSLHKIERNIGNYKQKHNIYDLTTEGSAIFSEATSLDKIKEELNGRLEYFNNLEYYINSHKDYKDIPAPAIINMEDASITGTVNRLTELSLKKEQLAQKVTNNHPSLKVLNEEISMTRSVLLENLSNLKAATAISLKNNKSRFNTYSYKLRKLPKKEQQLLNFQRKYALNEANYVFLMQKRYEASMAIAASVSDITVLDSAKDTGEGSARPNKKFNYLVALLLGLVLPTILIIIKELFNTKIHTVEEIESVTSIPVLGVIGRSFDEKSMVIQNNINSSVSETFRALRSNIHFLLNNKKKGEAKIILATSSVSGEGKTFVSMNLASIFALAGKKTVVVGFDLRKPKLFDGYGMKNDIGVVNYLINERTIEEITQQTSVKNLDLINSGPVPPNPSELIIHENTSIFMDKLKEKYDFIILDTPPVGLVSDAFDLMKYTDTNLYVVRQNYSDKRMLKMITNKYIRKEVSKMNIILNDFDIKASYGTYGYGYGYGYGNYTNGYHSDTKKKSWFKRLFKKK